MLTMTGFKRHCIKTHAQQQQTKSSISFHCSYSVTANDLPSTLGYTVNHGKKAKKKLAAPNISLTLDHSEGSLISDELDESTELDLDGIDTPSDNSNEFEWEGKNFILCNENEKKCNGFWKPGLLC